LPHVFPPVACFRCITEASQALPPSALFFLSVVCSRPCFDLYFCGGPPLLAILQTEGGSSYSWRLELLALIEIPLFFLRFVEPFSRAFLIIPLEGNMFGFFSNGRSLPPKTMKASRSVLSIVPVFFCLWKFFSRAGHPGHNAAFSQVAR